MKNFILMKVLGMLVNTFDSQLIREGLEKALDHIETRILESQTKADDVLLLPVLRAVRQAINLPDDDDVG